MYKSSIYSFSSSFPIRSNKFVNENEEEEEKINKINFNVRNKYVYIWYIKLKEKDENINEIWNTKKKENISLLLLWRLYCYYNCV